jgi:hypothetical protein
MIKFAFALGTGLAFVLTGCSSTTDGSAIKTGSVSSTTSSAPTSSNDFPSSTAPLTESDAPGSGCVPGADYCDTFDDDSSGWPVDNPTHYYAGYDTFQGGTYRMGERTNAAISEDAPYDVTDAANDYSVQVDVDATPGEGFGGTNELGVVCWEHEIEGAGGVTSAFLLELSLTEAKIGLWDGADGSYHEITSAAAAGALDPAGTSHLTAQCIQGTSNGQAQAQLSLSVNGAEVVSVNYAKGLSTYDWSVGEHVGLLAIGEGSDVFYDNFAVTGKCAGDFC